MRAMVGKYEKFKLFWETYNGFALIALVFGILSLFFGWFKAGSNLLYIRDLLFINQTTSLLGLLFFLGFIFLIFYYLGSVLKNLDTVATPFEEQLRTFFSVSTLLFIFFMVLTFMYFDPGTVCVVNGYISCICFWDIDIGFILGVLMIGMLIVSYGYEGLMLRRHYQEHLPDYTPL